MSLLGSGRTGMSKQQTSRRRQQFLQFDGLPQQAELGSSLNDALEGSLSPAHAPVHHTNHKFDIHLVFVTTCHHNGGMPQGKPDSWMVWLNLCRAEQEGWSAGCPLGSSSRPCSSWCSLMYTLGSEMHLQLVQCRKFLAGTQDQQLADGQHLSPF